MKKAVAALLCLWAIAGTAQQEPFAYRPAIPSPDAEHALLVDLDWAGDRLVAAGEQGHIIYSDDSGTTWQHAEVPVSLMLTAVDFPAPDAGWAVGHEGIALTSADRGETWSVALTGEDIAELQIDAAKELIDEARARLENAADGEREDAQWALEEAEFALEDAERAREEGITHPALNVWFQNERSGYITGAYGLLLYTDDGGEAWKLRSHRLDNPNGFHLYDIGRSESGALLIAGEAGQLHRSRDNGDTWQALDSPYEGSFFGVLTTEAGSVLIFGLRGRIFRSEDDGDTWAAIDAPGESTLFGGQVFPDGRIVLVGAAGTVLESRDDGQSFTALPLDSRASLAAVERVGNGRMFIAGFGGIRTGLDTAEGAAP
ncbi:MAG TPA: YCF48-related protein [Woeseiaceae bacterium]|nr:YCF48-related protein [Woeseiaceae bacterium]